MEGRQKRPETKTNVLEGGGGRFRTFVICISPREPTIAPIWMHNENCGIEELETLRFWKTIVLQDVDMLNSCALHLSTEKKTLSRGWTNLRFLRIWAHSTMCANEGLFANKILTGGETYIF